VLHRLPGKREQEEEIFGVILGWESEMTSSLRVRENGSLGGLTRISFDSSTRSIRLLLLLFFFFNNIQHMEKG
jgi:hypothetical protein